MPQKTDITVTNAADLSIVPLVSFMGKLALGPLSILLLGGIVTAISGGSIGVFVGAFAFVHIGVFSSYFVHELGHFFAVKCSKDDAVQIGWEFTLWRVSLVVVGSRSHLKAALAGLAGPGLAVLFGGIVELIASLPLPSFVVSLLRLVAICYLAHGVFLLPFCGDGRLFWRNMVSRRDSHAQSLP